MRGGRLEGINAYRGKTSLLQKKTTKKGGQRMKKMDLRHIRKEKKRGTRSAKTWRNDTSPATQRKKPKR